MKKRVIKDWTGYKKVSEENDNEFEVPFRLYGEGITPQSELIEELKSMVAGINKATITDQDSYDRIKADIITKKDKIMSHPNFDEFKETGFEWQDETIKLSDWQEELRDAVASMSDKANKKGLS